MRRRVLNVDYDSEARWFTSEEDGEQLVTTLGRTFGGSSGPTKAPQRLCTDIEAAAYLGISRSAVRALVANGDLKRVRLPSTDGRGRTARVLRIDVKDLDAVIERSKG